MVQYHFWKRSFWTIFDPFSVDTHGPKIPQNAAKRARGGQKPLVAVGLGHSEGQNQQEVGVCLWQTCPRIRDWVCLARDTAIFRFQPAGHIRGPNEPILGPTDTVSGPHGAKHGQKATQVIPKLILSINLDNGTFWAPLGGTGAHFW